MITNLLGRTVSYDDGSRVVVGEVVIVELEHTNTVPLLIGIRERGGGQFRIMPLTSLDSLQIDPATT